jgi:hypothetical protein
MEDRLILISAFWRNDCPDGVGCTFEFQGNDGETMAKLIEDTVKVYDQHPEVPVEEYVEQLRAIGLTPIDLRDEQMLMLAMINIAWLERRGHIPTDEFNGMLYVRLIKGEPTPSKVPFTN